ncbi:MAG TPA: hypothetical protein VMG09_04775, partial [Bacteroidota bacterium]|nr:hypothetical protein [Bacteroidota bacterium]
MRAPALCFALIVALAFPTATAQWAPTGGPEGGEINSIVSNGPMTFAGTFNGVFRSTNNGITWTPISAGLTNKYITCVRLNGSSLISATAVSVFRSSDNGDHWTVGGTG